MASFKKFLTVGCVINTVLMTCFYLLAAFLPGFDLIPRLSTMFTVLAFSFILSAAERVLEAPFSMAGRIALHYVICLGGFLALFLIGNKNAGNPAQLIIGTVFFTFAYILVNIARFIVMERRVRAENEKLEYTPAFKK